LVTLPKNFWARVLGSVVIQLYAGSLRVSGLYVSESKINSVLAL